MLHISVDAAMRTPTLGSVTPSLIVHGSIGSRERVPCTMHVIGHEVELGKNILDLINLNLLNLVRSAGKGSGESIVLSSDACELSKLVLDSLEEQGEVDGICRCSGMVLITYDRMVLDWE